MEVSQQPFSSGLKHTASIVAFPAAAAAQGAKEGVPLPARPCPGPQEWGSITEKSLLSMVYPVEMALATRS